MQSRTVFLLSLIVVGTLAAACLNDSDSLKTEASGLPAVVDVIAGRFDRNPDLYYEMRLERVTKAVKQDPRDFILYDDAAVACDRLGDDELAIAWMDRKKKAMDEAGIGPDAPERYNYFANIGTVRAHKWFRRGAKAEEVHLLKKAYEEIKEAVRIKPDAHFGREWIQLKLMGDILLDLLPISKEGNLAAEHRALMRSHVSEDEFKAAPIMVEGLTGIIVLGAGWDSEKVWGAMWRWLDLDRQGHLAELAEYRWHELGGAVHLPLNETSGGRAYKALRANGDEYTRHRQEFMLAKMKLGKHPDNDPGFWSGYTPVPPLDLSPYSVERSAFWGSANGAVVKSLLLVTPVVIVGWILVRWAFRRRTFE